MRNSRYALSRFPGDKVAYLAKCFLGLLTKCTSIFDHKWDEIAVVKLLVGVLVPRILDVFLQFCCVLGVPSSIYTLGWSR